MSWNKTHSKALDEKVARIKSANQELREQLKAKDEEIHYLKTQMTGWSMMFDEPQDAKARSIVAMLFWRAKKDKRLAGEENKYFTYNVALHSFILFKQAYKMLKEQQ